MKRIVLLFSYLACFFVTANIHKCQAKQAEHKKDSLLNELATAKTDIDKINIWYAIGISYNFSNADSCQHYGEKILCLAQKLGNNKAFGLGNHVLGNAAFNRGYFTNSLKYYLEAVSDLEDEPNVSNILFDLYLQLATNYGELSDYSTGEIYLRTASKLPNPPNMGMLYNNWGDLLDKQEKYVEALEMYQRSLHEAQLSDNQLSMAFVYCNLGYVYYHLKQFDLSKRNFVIALALSKKIRDVEGILYDYAEMANMYYAKQEVDSSLIYVDSAQQLLVIYPNLKLQKNIYFLLSDIYEQKKQDNLALLYYKKGSELKDSLFNRFRQKLITEQTVNQKIKSLEKESSKKELELARQKQKTIGVYILVFALAITSFFLLILNHQRKKHNLQLRQKNTQINEQREALKQLNQTKDKLISVISHDLRAPLNQLKSLFELLLNHLLTPEEFLLYAKKIKAQLNHTSEDMENTLYWISTQMNGVTVKKEAFELKEIALQVQQIYQEQLEYKHLNLNISIPNNTVVQTDKEHLKLVLRNLIANAIKFSYPNTAIYIISEIKSENLLIHVTDTGIGMSTQQQQQLFQNNQHFTSLGTQKEKGTGLGLKLSKEFIEKSGGDLWVNSEEGKGSTFTIVLPNFSNSLQPAY